MCTISGQSSLPCLKLQLMKIIDLQSCGWSASGEPFGPTFFAELQWMDLSKDITNEGEADEPGASAGNGVEKRGDNCGSSKVR